MEQEIAAATRRRRSDARRNRERLLEAAREIFAVGGPGASLEAVAREADVGIGTLYRHFPTREALFQAVYRREVDQLVDLADRLAADPQPTDALRRWLHANVGMIATKKGMLTALAPALDNSRDLYVDTFARLTRAAAALMQRAAEAGEIRSDISPEDVLHALVGMCYTRDQPDWQTTVLRLIDVFVDGLRTQAQ